ncbi:MAG: hypothetical protein ACLFVG_00655 [Candidatus Aminicenantes bacterium]
MTTELERIKILEGKITQVVDFINKVLSENQKLKEQMKELKAERKKFEGQAKQSSKLDESLKRYEKEREVIKAKIEGIISQIDQIGII